MRLINVGLFVVVVMSLIAFLSSTFTLSRTGSAEGSIYDFKMTSLSGEEIDFSRFKGKPLLIVNTASKCGFTPQYADLQRLHEDYGDRVTVVGFPANNFLWQEPGSNEDIASFCQKNYGVTFLMFEKISVKGRHAHPLYKWLAAKTGKTPTWNFCKYLVDTEGNVTFYPSKVNPLDNEILSKL